MIFKYIYIHTYILYDIYIYIHTYDIYIYTYCMIYIYIYIHTYYIIHTYIVMYHTTYERFSEFDPLATSLKVSGRYAATCSKHTCRRIMRKMMTRWI